MLLHEIAKHIRHANTLSGKPLPPLIDAYRRIHVLHRMLLIGELDEEETKKLAHESYAVLKLINQAWQEQNNK